MAAPSRPPSFKAYGVKAQCSGCGRRLSADEPGGLWFQGGPVPAVFGRCCRARVTVTVERKVA